MSCQRHIWIQLLRHACATYHTFLLTFPFDKISTSEIEQAVTSPFRFTAALKHAACTSERRSALIPNDTRIIYHRDLVNSSQFLDNSAMYLVPGGRFLLMSSKTGIMNLLDLGYNIPKICVKPTPSGAFHHLNLPMYFPKCCFSKRSSFLYILPINTLLFVLNSLGSGCTQITSIILILWVWQTAGQQLPDTR